MPDHAAQGPRAREENLAVEPIGDELLVFDAEVGRAHSLNPTAAVVWEACDGARTPEQIAEHCGLDPHAVDLALETLNDSKLLVGYTPGGERVSRRAVIRRMAVTGAAAGVALPVIRSIVAPSPAMAASNGRVKGNAGSSCTKNSQCAPSSYCQAGPGSCQRALGASCSHTVSCLGNGSQVYPCVNGTCQHCTSNGQCSGGKFCGTGICRSN